MLRFMYKYYTKATIAAFEKTIRGVDDASKATFFFLKNFGFKNKNREYHGEFNFQHRNDVFGMLQSFS